LVSADYLHGRIANLYDPVFGVVLILLLISLFKTWRMKGKNGILAHLAALAMFLTVPLGSNNGIRNAVFGLWLSVPIALQFLGDDKKKGVSYSFFSFQSLNRSSLLKAFAVVLLLSAGSAIAFRYTYRDSANRWEMRFSIDHPKLKGVLTTRERAFVVQGVLLKWTRLSRQKIIEFLTHARNNCDYLMLTF